METIMTLENYFNQYFEHWQCLFVYFIAALSILDCRMSSYMLSDHQINTIYLVHPAIILTSQYKVCFSPINEQITIYPYRLQMRGPSLQLLAGFYRALLRPVKLSTINLWNRAPFVEFHFLFNYSIYCYAHLFVQPIYGKARASP